MWFSSSVRMIQTQWWRKTNDCVSTESSFLSGWNGGKQAGKTVWNDNLLPESIHSAHTDSLWMKTNSNYESHTSWTSHSASWMTLTNHALSEGWCRHTPDHFGSSSVGLHVHRTAGVHVRRQIELGELGLKHTVQKIKYDTHTRSELVMWLVLPISPGERWSDTDQITLRRRNGQKYKIWVFSNRFPLATPPTHAIGRLLNFTGFEGTESRTWITDFYSP